MESANLAQEIQLGMRISSKHNRSVGGRAVVRQVIVVLPPSARSAGSVCWLTCRRVVDSVFRNNTMSIM